MAPAVLEREYSPSSMVGGDISGYLEAYAERSAVARRDFPCREDVRYGPSATQITLAHPPFDPQGLEHLLLLSGIYDLDPILLTSINDLLGLDAKRAHALSPMFLVPTVRPGVTVAVAERDTNEFRRQGKDFA